MKEETRQKKQIRFILQSERKHNLKYDYSKVYYEGDKIHVTIICPFHGEFIQTPQKHKIGQECIKCSKGKLDTKEFINRACEIHEDIYDYSNTIYTSFHKKLDIICKSHGVFSQRADYHLSGGGCPTCAQKNRLKYYLLSKDEFIKRSNEIHNNRYDYSTVIYKGVFKKVSIICKKHGIFYQTPDCHFKGYNCPICSGKRSQHELRLNDFLSPFMSDVFQNNRDIISPYELDIYIPSLKFAIEFCGLYLHSEPRKEKNYHKRKLDLCKEKGISLLTIFEDEWLQKKGIVKAVIKNKLGISERGIYARNTNVKEIPSSLANGFYNNTHLQGSTRAKIHLGCFHNNDLIAIMSFGNTTRQSKYQWELRRYSTNGKNNPGVASKLFKYFINNFDPSNIVSFSDNRWSNGNLYNVLGFENSGNLYPDYYYVKQDKRYHKSGFRKSQIDKKLGKLLPNETENESMKRFGFKKIWDCGKTRFVWNKNHK